MSTKASEEEPQHHDESDIADEFIDDVCDDDGGCWDVGLADFFLDFAFQDGDKAGYFPGKTITLQMLLGANVLQPGKGAMSIEYLVSLGFFWTGITPPH